MMNQRRSQHRIFRQWFIGLYGSWLCVWLCGPWLVNSILVRVHDPVLESITLREGDLIRWRSEGWATTLIGPHGLPGWKPNQAKDRIVIWGDSQVEGCCVDDPDKISNQIIRIATEKQPPSIDCLPLGRSGSDAADWDRQTMAVDAEWQPIAHVWIVTELSDLLALIDDKADSTSKTVYRWQAESPAPVLWAKRVHAEALFQATRNLLLDATTGSLRSLRWAVGPVRPTNTVITPERSKVLATSATADRSLIDRLITINQQLEHRLLLVYAPATPRIAGGIVTEHPDDAAWQQLDTLLRANSIATIDMRPMFIEQWIINGELTRGFHNGTPGVGHLNPLGNQLIAAAIVHELEHRRAQVGAMVP